MKSHFVWKFTGKMPDPIFGGTTLREPAQSKRTWTFANGHFFSYFTGELRGESAAHSPAHLDLHRALTLTVRTPQCGHTVWGIKKIKCEKPISHLIYLII